MYLLQVLGQAGADIPIHAKNGDIDEFGTAVGHLATAVCQITEAGAQVNLSIHWHCCGTCMIVPPINYSVFEHCMQ